MAATSNEPSDMDFDDKFSRMAFLGRENMRKFRETAVLIVGVNGLSAEIGKNIILANIYKVTLWDTADVAIGDLGAHFYLSESDVGSNRAAACVAAMQELNPDVSVESSDAELTAEFVSGYQVVVSVNQSHETNLMLNGVTRANGAKFIKAGVWGLFGTVFVDCGDEFIVHDATGENPRVSIIDNITKANPGVVSFIFDEEGRHDLETGDMVTFSEVKGMEELNDGVPRRITVINPYAFSIDDTSGYGDYAGGGISTQFKEPKTLNFKSYEESLADPGMLLESDFAKFGRPYLLHVLYQGLDAYAAENGRLPAPGSAEDADALVAATKALNEAKGDAKIEWDETAEAVCRKLAYGATAVLNPLCAIFGGLVGQEVLKVCTGKYHPVYQWFHYDALEALQENWPLDADQYAPQQSRYDHQIAVFGKDFQDKLLKLNYFLVGAGALGCEYLKNFALMGVGCSEEGSITVTDDDVIERSNLSRQFLFRNHHVGKSKSECAAESAEAINPAVSITALKERVAPNTEEVFNDDFWLGLSGVCNALDNIKARLYVDQRCVFFHKSLLESGTLGPKCNSQVVLPGMTENYGASRDPPEKEAPQCTIHSFPHNIDHCLVWARSEFVGNFDKSPTETNKYVADPEGYVPKLQESGAGVYDILDNLRGNNVFGGGILGCIGESQSKTWEDCVGWARCKFQTYCNDAIRQLTFAFPEDAVNKKTGKPFWSAPKRFPTALEFDADDDMHMQFIEAAAVLRARTSGVAPGDLDRAALTAIVEKTEVPVFEPSSAIAIDDGEDDGEKKAETVDSGSLEEVTAALPTGDALADASMVPEEFEKDDDKNHHIAFVQALGNLRARAYGIEEIDALGAKLKAGRIIPAIATTTAMITGFVGVELYKTLSEDKPIEAYRNVFANLALPIFVITEPMPAGRIRSRTEKRIPDPNHPEYVEEQEVVAIPDPHTVWDSHRLSGDLTVGDLAEHFKNEAEVTLTQLAINDVLLYSLYMPSHKDRVAKPIIELAAEKGVTFPDSVKLIPLDCNFETADDKEAELPRIVLLRE